MCKAFHTKKDIYVLSILAALQTTTIKGMVREMQHSSTHNTKHQKARCAGCGKTFGPNELTVSYDFERYYCFRCDDARQAT